MLGPGRLHAHGAALVVLSLPQSFTCDEELLLRHLACVPLLAVPVQTGRYVSKFHRIFLKVCAMTEAVNS